MLHDLYKDDKAVGQLTQLHLDAGRSVFQLWMLDPDERRHSEKVLEALQLPILAEVLSLGCGVGGMERYWKDARHDLTFTLLNQSQAQLDLCVCPGDKVHCEAEKYQPWFSHQITLIAYALGHMEATHVLLEAQEYTSGPIIVLDVFDGTAEFCRELAYDTVTSDRMKSLGFREVPVGPWVLNPLVDEEGMGPIVSQSTPKLWILE